VISVDVDLAEPFVRALSDDFGFDTDITHFSVHGRCSDCRAAQTL
jgi:Fur family ferric uptake transcriptional regulator